MHVYPWPLMYLNQSQPKWTVLSLMLNLGVKIYKKSFKNKQFMDLQTLFMGCT